MSVEEAAIALGISRAFAYEAVARGEIPCIHIGKRILVPIAGLNRLLESAGLGVPPTRRNESLTRDCM
jgi:excisionase family DNA binding protein